MPIAPAIIAAGIGAGSGLLGDIISGINIRRMNKYNSPINQVKRLREARLPMAALTSGNAGQQSALAETSGLKSFGGQIAQGVATQSGLQQQKLTAEQIRSAAAAADTSEGTRNYLLEGAGEDSAGTNLTANLKTEQAQRVATVSGTQIANKIASGEAENQAFKLNAENKKLQAETAKILKDTEMIDEKIESENIEQKIQNVLSKYTERMTNAQLGKLLKENGLISEHIHGARLENAAGIINNRILEETAGNMIDQSDISTMMSKLGLQSHMSEYLKSKAYNDMVAKGQELFKRHSGQEINFNQFADGLAALLYTSIVNFTGGGNIPMPGLILGGIGTGGAAQKTPKSPLKNLDTTKHYKYFVPKNQR